VLIISFSFPPQGLTHALLSHEPGVISVGHPDLLSSRGKL